MQVSAGFARFYGKERVNVNQETGLLSSTRMLAAPRSCIEAPRPYEKGHPLHSLPTTDAISLYAARKCRESIIGFDGIRSSQMTYDHRDT
jgi:hypothetical protein